MTKTMYAVVFVDEDGTPSLQFITADDPFKAAAVHPSVIPWLEAREPPEDYEALECLLNNNGCLLLCEEIPSCP